MAGQRRLTSAMPGKTFRLAPYLAVALMLAGFAAAGLAQTPPKAKTEARFAGGFYPDACRWPREARRQQLSACCQMDLEIDAQGQMVKGDGECTHEMFLAPTLRCLAAQRFIPATRNGAPVSDLQHLEYEWRATTPAGELCNKLKSS